MSDAPATTLDRACEDAAKAASPELVRALRSNVERGLMTVHQRESGEFCWAITAAGRAAAEAARDADRKGLV